jgi:hypothetical protein
VINRNDQLSFVPLPLSAIPHCCSVAKSCRPSDLLNGLAVERSKRHAHKQET